MPRKAQSNLVRKLRSYLFTGSLAVNALVQVIMIANILSIRYFLYMNLLTVHIDLVPNEWSAIAWIATLYIVYLTKDETEDNELNRLDCFLKVSLVGSCILSLSLILAAVETFTSQELAILITLRPTLTAVGYILSFVGVDLIVFIIMVQSKKTFQLFLIYFLGLLIPFEMWALGHWIAYPFDVESNLGFAGFAGNGAFLELQLFYLGYPVILLLFLASLFFWAMYPLLPAATETIRHIWKIKVKTLLLGSKTSRFVEKNEYEGVSICQDLTLQEHSKYSPVGRAILLISLVLGVFISVYPYISTRSGLVGADSLGYYYTFVALAGKTPQNAIQLITQINSARVLYFVIMYFVGELTHISPHTLVQLLPIATLIANVLAIFWFVKRHDTALVASMVALFSLFSFHTSVALHAGILANWLALALGFVAFGITLELNRRSSFKRIFAAVSVWITVLLIHYWSALFFLAVLICYGLLKQFEGLNRVTRLAVGLSMVSIAVLIAPYVNELAPFFVSYGTAPTLGIAGAAFLFGTKLQTLIDTWFFGAFANPVMLSLASIGIIGCFYRKTKLDRLVIAWTACGGLFSLLVSPIGTNINQWLLWRTLYLVPFQIPAVFGLCMLVRRFGSILNIRNLKVTGCNASSQPSKPSVRDMSAFAFLVVGYVSASILLVLDMPFIPVLAFTFLSSTLIIHFTIRENNKDSLCTWILVLCVILSLLNCTLRILAPLALNHFQP